MDKKTIWITGVNGSIGKVLYELLGAKDKYNLIGTDKKVSITDFEILKQKASEIKPDVIVNCAGLTDPEYCEAHKVEAYRINALGARNLAETALVCGAKFIHFSSDDVFSGERDKPKNEFDPAFPDTVYGASKRAGEMMVMELNPRNTVIRSSWVYGIDDDYFNFVCSSAENGKVVKAPIDRVSTPTSIKQIAGLIEAVIEKDAYGIIHAASKGMCSRYHYATTILELMGYSTSFAEAVFSGVNGARTSTVLEDMMLEMTGIYTMPDWLDDLKKYIAAKKA